MVKRNISPEKQKKTKYKNLGILYYCDIPASYVKYEVFDNSRNIITIPTINKARKRKKGIARCPDSFRPSLKMLRKREVHMVYLHFDNKHKLIKIEIVNRNKNENRFFLYKPLI